MKDILRSHIQDVLIDWGISQPSVIVEYPTHEQLGDYTTNVALVYGKAHGENPKNFAENMVVELTSKHIEHIDHMEIAGPGFINFFLSETYAPLRIDQAHREKEWWGTNETYGRKKTIVEYTDPNPFKEFHIGHLMSNTIGESISRLYEANGAEVKRACYQGDLGLHIATSVWGIRDLGIDIAYATPSDLGKAYAHGSQKMKEDEAIKKEIVEINKHIFARDDESINTLYDTGRQISLTYFEYLYTILGTTFDYYFFESESAPVGKQIVLDHVGDIFTQSDGAIVFKGETFDESLHTRVFVNSEGLPTYEAKELGLSHIKYEKYPYETSVVITGNEINDYFKVLLSAMSKVFPEYAEKTVHLSHGMLRLPTGKMSSRTGQVITFMSLFEEVRKEIRERMKDRDMSEEEKEKISTVVSVGALKYSILKQTIGKDIVFDVNTSLSFEGDSGPYLQYGYVRAQSILDKAEEVSLPMNTTLPQGWKKTHLETLIARFDEVVKRAGDELAPHQIATYLIQLTGEFNSFYTNHKIIDTNDSSSPYKLALVGAYGWTVRNGLKLLGIDVPHKM